MIIRNFSVHFGTKRVYQDFSADIPDGKVTCILGASGCGKTTLLNGIAGTIPYTGSVDKVSDKIAYIFQTPVLLRHLTVAKNLDFVLRRPIPNKAERIARIENALRAVNLYDEKDAYPTTLSGGMAQRTELARAYAYEPSVLLMDEPFHALDVSLKKSMIALFRSLFLQKNVTTVIVTHDVDEAILLADKILVIGNGLILLDEDLPERDTPSVEDFPDVRKRIFDLL